MMMFTIRSAIWQQDKALLREIRTSVFVQEQQVSSELEWDDRDKAALHWLALDEQARPVGTCRMLLDGRIGRMATLKACRGNGIGRALLDSAVDCARTLQLCEAYLYAQTQAITFYQRAGFIVSGEEFMEANIPHKIMRLRLTK